MASRISALLPDTIVIAVYSSMPWMTKSSVRAAVRYVRMEYSAVLDAEHRHRDEKQDDVESENHVADAQQRAALADEQRRDLGSVEHRPAAHGETDARAEKESAEHGVEQAILRDRRVMHQRKHEREHADGERAAHRERRAQVPVAEEHERHVDDGKPERQRQARHHREQQRHARDTAVDEAARQQEAFQPQTGGQNAEENQDGVEELASHACDSADD